MLALAAFMGLLLLKSPEPSKQGEEITWGRMTSVMLPLLTYKEENGNPDMVYASKYEVPEWFYEDENAPESDTLSEASMQEKMVAETEKPQIQEATAGITSYTKEQLAQPNFLLEHIFVVDSNTSMAADEISLDNLLTDSVRVENLTYDSESGIENAPPKILIYHTHGSESFVDSRPNEKEDTIVGVGAYLTEILENEYHIPVYHDETAYDVIDGKLDRSKAYENAYANITKILADNPSIEVVIDLHRDGVEEETHLVTTVNEKPTAKIMFLNGVSRSNMNGDIAYLNNPNKKMNLAFSFQMYLAGKEKYGDYIRKIYVRSLRYNLHVMPRTTLIEVGAQNNTLEEEKNAMEPLADILNAVLSGEDSF